MVIGAGPAIGAFGWTGPVPVGTVTGCTDVDLALDTDGVQHVVAECNGNVRYVADVGGTWDMVTFSHPEARVDVQPHIAVEENTIYVAYTRLIAESDAPPIGIYYRLRRLDGATWSTAVRLGDSGDRIDDFVVVAGTIHATITSRGGDIFYVRGTPGALTRYRLPGASGRAVVRMGDDGAPRFVYEAANRLRYAVFHGTAFDWSAIPGTDAGSVGPALALDGESKAHVTWTHIRVSGATTVAAADGVFYATNASGEWTDPEVRRVSGAIGRSALALNPITGRPHVIVGGTTGVRYYTPAATGAWTPLTLTEQGAGDIDAAVRAVGSASGGAITERVLLIGSAIGADFVAGGLFSMTKP